MRTFVFALVTTFALGLVAGGPAMAECFDGHKAKTADVGSPNIADGQLPQTPKPDQGS